ncbi:MAG TPA: hypothetical protein DDX39_07790 [Bacteroidales bacterium]|nr:MAG: hypothetical protein A2W98_14325 [Bacteroidetes bacterium GWF2_33_38]OFY74906.1 MAG: hypothetical protein A2265_10265 [Bacteroidetes bacterium RIFOXYA12_FULL_33_9]OFY90445.1 MAG: hypothetical protein A2236_11025 [Bacteroidetes bacterium RIFOXYA2_FULL_33_7]HBF88527.1 hypothetical protein [Bacteroidales bacterium]
MSNSKQIHIAIIGQKSSNSYAHLFAIIRTLREIKCLEIRIIVFTYDAYESGILNHNLIDKCYCIPSPKKNKLVFLSRLDHIVSEEIIDYIIPCYDKNFIDYIKLKPQFKKRGIRMLIPSIIQYNSFVNDFFLSSEKIQNINIPSKKLIRTKNDIHNDNYNYNYPIYVSNLFGELSIEESKEQLERQYNKLLIKKEFPVFIQETCKVANYKFLALGDGTGNTREIISVKKIQNSSTDTAWISSSENIPKIENLIRSFINKTKWFGAIEFEFEIKKSNECFLVGAKPHFPDWVYFAAKAGNNIPELFLQLLLGMHISNEKKKTFENKIHLKYSWDIIMDKQEFENFMLSSEI